MSKSVKEDWVETSILEACEIHDNLRKPINAKERMQRIKGKKNEELYPYYGATGQVGYIDDYLTEGDFVLVGEDAAPFLDYTKDVAYKISGKTWVNNHAHILKSKFNDDFLLHYLNNFNFIEYVSGTTRLKLTQGRLKQIPIILPPLVEQQAIVRKIEELFSSLDSGIADLEKAQNQLKTYRQAVLKKAFEGDWELTYVGELFDFKGGGTPSKREPKYWNGKIPWASVKDIKGDFLNHTQDYITEEGLKNSSANMARKHEIILITRISPGKSIISKIDAAINQDLKIVKPKFETFNKFIHYLFKSIKREVVKLSSGTTVKGINLNNLKSIKIPNIDIKEQHQIVQEIESRLSVCDAVEQNIQDSLEKAQALRQSILKKAFEGKLLSEEEIATCKAHKDYEPARVLLERIKAEKKEKEKQ